MGKRSSLIRSVVTFVLVSCTLLLSCLLVAGCNVCIAGGSNDCPQSSGSSSGSGPSTSNLTNGSSMGKILWLSTAATGGDTVTGPAVISGDFDVNGRGVKDGVGNIGTVIILLDGSQYNLSGPNTGTRYYPTGGQPSDSDFSSQVEKVVQDQRHYGCQNGCSQSKVVYFVNGSQKGDAQYE